MSTFRTFGAVLFCGDRTLHPPKVGIRNSTLCSRFYWTEIKEKGEVFHYKLRQRLTKLFEQTLLAPPYPPLDNVEFMEEYQRCRHSSKQHCLLGVRGVFTNKMANVV